MERISVIGLGKLGASMAASFAMRGFDVVGVDINQNIIDAVNQGKAPVQETDLEKTIYENRERIRATLSTEDAILNSDISFVIVPTPSDERGSFSLQYAEWAFKAIAKAIGKKDSYINIVLTSTVLPGSTRQALIPILEEESGKSAGKDFGVCYSPEFIALGSIINDFLNPDFTLIGEFDDRCGEQLESLYSRVVTNGAPSARMSLENAELTKISINSFITTKITFANMLANICENLPGGDIDVVTNAIGMDKRIGRRYLTGSIGYGGPCFPRDNVALSFIARELGVSAHLAETTDSMNRSMIERIVLQVLPLIERGSTVAVLGLSYKPFSHVIEESQGVLIAESLARRGVRVVAYDPMSDEMPVGELRRHFVVLDSLEDCIQQADVVLIATPDPVFSALRADSFRKSRKNVAVFDFWRILRSELSGKANIDYYGAGLDLETKGNTARLRDIWTGQHRDFSEGGDK